MLSTVRMLRRLLRRAFLVTNRVNVIFCTPVEPKRKRGVLASRPAQSKQATRINERVRFSQPASDPEKTRHGNNHLPPYSIRERPNASGDRHTACMTIVTLLSVNELNLYPKRKVTPEAPLFLRAPEKIDHGFGWRGGSPTKPPLAQINEPAPYRFTLFSQYFGNSNLKLPSAILPLTCPRVLTTQFSTRNCAAFFWDEARKPCPQKSVTSKS